MKIVVLLGGIGNQLFQYVFYCYLQSKGHRVYYKDETLSGLAHNGRELDKYFQVNIRPVPWIVTMFLKCSWRFFPKYYKQCIATDQNYLESKLLFIGYWMNKKFRLPTIEVQFKPLPLNHANQAVLEQIQITDSISLHVRRGDYLLPECTKRFCGICTKEYYQEAISFMCKKRQAAKFFVFSDDIPWCREHLPVTDAVFVDWNTGNDSIYDMYLMSHCKANIIANSTFSYWGAIISNNSDVIYPKKWFGDIPAPDIFPPFWRGI